MCNRLTLASRIKAHHWIPGQIYLKKYILWTTFGAPKRVASFPSPYNFQGTALRHIMIDGEPWFAAPDICRCIGLDMQAGAFPHIRYLDTDETQIIHRQSNPTFFQGTRGGHHCTLVSESGLYKLVMRSNKPQAREFQNWVTREVLPSIRKTGGYLLKEEAREVAHADDDAKDVDLRFP